MKLTEILVSIMIFLISTTAFLGVFANFQRISKKTSMVTETASAVITADYLLRREIQEIKIPYWRNFHKASNSLIEKISNLNKDLGIEIVDVKAFYEKSHAAEGIQVDWNLNGKNYVTREYIRQRITDEEER